MHSALEVSPETELQFTLSREGEASPRCTLTLRHPGTTNEHLAFKVKTTQPRRYLVRPNQGLVAPGGSETISILLVEKDKNLLLQSYDRLGQSALDHSKDKFLVQSCAVSDEFSTKYQQEKDKQSNNNSTTAAATSKELTDALTSVWNTMSSSNANQIVNKKLHVKHVVDPTTTTTTTTSSTPLPLPHDTTTTPLTDMERLSHDQLLAEVVNLRRKYDELVSFSVNLTAERDVLNNTLEQTKRDFNRELAARMKLQQGGRGAASSVTASGTDVLKRYFLWVLLLVLAALVSFVGGVRFTNLDQVGFLERVPVLQDWAFPGGVVTEEVDVAQEL